MSTQRHPDFRGEDVTFTHGARNPKQKSGLTFLQPNTVVSSRAAIFGDDFQSRPHHNHTNTRSNRTKDSSEDDNDDEDEELSKSILAKLYGQLEGAMEIEEDDPTPRIAADMDTKQEDTHASSSQQDVAGQGENEDTAMEFRLFATQDTPTKISLVHKPAQEVTQLLEATHRLRREVDENPGSERMLQMQDAAIDAMTVLEQAKTPWARTFFEHKVIHVPFRQPNPAAKTKPSRAKREWAKKVKSGEIDLATAQATARKVKVSESYGRKPFMERKGLGRNTIDAGTDASKHAGSGGRGGRGGRGGARGGRGVRGASRGGRGGARGGHHGSKERDAKESKEGDRKESLSAVAKNDSTKKRDATSQDSKTPAKPIKKPKTDGHDSTSKPKPKPEASTSTVPKAVSFTSSAATAITSLSSTPKAALPLKKPKAKKDKPTSKIDNIMAMLMSK
ncbi:hypothetical protein BGZ82_008028 [Podila clonocystis]|nr:hypothetical protein BGZ82_008028 [Podila clonocystis]